MRIALVFGLCLIAFAASAGPRSQPVTDEAVAAERLGEIDRARLNENVVTIMAGAPGGTGLSIAYDLAEVLDDGNNLRVVPMIGKGVEQNVRDLLYLRGVDMAITQANILKHFARTGALGQNLGNQITYVAKLFNEEMHVLVRPEITDISQLGGHVVSLGEEGSGSHVTARLVFDALGVAVEAVHLGDAEAIAKLKSGEIAAAVMLGGKPAPIVAHLEDAAGLRLLPIPYNKELENDYYPATLQHDDYPELIAEGESIDTVSVCAVLVAFNWPKKSERAKKVAKFVDAFFSKFDAFREPPRHPKWREVNFAATLEGWTRSPIAQSWIARAPQPAQTASRNNFDAFLAQTAQAGGVPGSKSERAELFRSFLEWSKTRTSN